MSKKVYHDYPNEWMEQPLNKVCSIVDYRGKTPTKVNEGILLVTAKNIKFGSIDYSLSQEYIKECDYDEVMRRGFVEIDDVLYTTEAPLGNVAQVDRGGIALAQRVVKFSGNDSLDNTYLKYFMMSEDFRSYIDEQATGSTVKGIKGSKLKVSPVAIPPIPEQKKIAKILSTVDGHIDAVDGMIEDLKELKKGLMQKLLTEGIGHTEFKDSAVGRIPVEWEVITLEECADVIDPQPDHRAPKVVENGYPYVGVGDFNEYGEMTFYKCRKVGLSAIEKQENSFTIEKGDMVFGKVGTLGSPRFIEYSSRYALSATMVLIKSFDNINNRYLYYYLQSDALESEVSRLRTGTTRPTIGIKNIRIINVAIPTDNEQEKIANLLSEIDESIDNYMKERDDLREFKKGLMQQLLTGKTRVKVDS